MKKFIFLFLVFFLVSAPAFALFAPDSNERPRQIEGLEGLEEMEEVPIGVSLLTAAGIGGLMVLVKKQKKFMKKHTFQFEKIKKRLREADYDE